MLKLLGKYPLRDAAARRLQEEPAGSALYPGGALASDEAVARRLRALESWQGDRAELSAFLSAQNPDPLPEQAKHLKAASDPSALFLLTGQQPGLLGGPLLWFCKGMTCAAWARVLSARLERPVIPVFWAAGDDSDLAECNALEFLEGGGVLSLDFPESEAPIPMSLRSLPGPGLESLFRALEAHWGDDASAIARAAYIPGRSVTEAFLHLARALLGPEGMVFVDGLAAARRAQPLLRRLARAAERFHQAVASASRRFPGGPVQVSLRAGAAPVFLLEHGRRRRLLYADAGGKTRAFAQGAEGRDLLPDLENRELLHSALSRPLAVETLFPVLGHVLGPAELRYFGQLSEAFPAFGLSFPPLAPRQHILACPEREWKKLEALGLRPGELPELGPSRLKARLLEKSWEKHPAARDFPDPAFQSFARALRQYREKLPPSGGLDAAQRRLERAFGRFREAARQAAFSGTGSEDYAAFLPVLRWLGNGAQDRHLNLMSLRNALGPEGFGELSSLLRGEEARLSVAVF